MAWNENLTKLNYLLADLYPITSESYKIVDYANLKKTHISFKDRSIDNWYAILSEADKNNQVLDVINAVRQDYPEHPTVRWIAQLLQGNAAGVEAPKVGDDLRWNGQKGFDVLEKLMGRQSTFLPISFLEAGVSCSTSVAKVILPQRNASATGFITERNLFVTNHHVIRSANEAKDARLQFNYQRDRDGLELTPAEFSLNPISYFKTSDEHDWTVVRIDGDANSTWGALPLKKIDVAETSHVNIIQHPNGDYKQIAMYHNVVAYADKHRVQYLTDTMPGSSGSPVFDSAWNVIALHHSGGWILEPQSEKAVYRNEGINISLIADALQDDL